MRIKSAPTIAAATLLAATAAGAQVRTGAAALGDWRGDAPGVVRRIGVADMPASPTPPTASPAGVVARPRGAAPKVPPGFTVAAFAELDAPRQIRVAPNGDIFVAETDAGRITVLRAAPGAARPSAKGAFATGLDRPFGIAFYPAGPDPRWVYVANNNSVVRFAYKGGDLEARGAPQTVVAKLANSTGGHSTRDIAFSPDGKVMYVSVGSGSNIAEDMAKKPLAEAKAWDAAKGATGAAWGREEDRADVLAFDPEGGGRRIFATGIRNCVTLAVNPTTSAPWCAVNERDSLGDDLPPDYVTHVRAKGFYGWPWYYIGDHADPRLKGQRPDLAGKAIVPDVLIQPHSAPLGMVFYAPTRGPAAFPTAWRGDAFVALHGSWNRAKRTGYKVVRLPMRGGAATGAYEDFLTGFVIDAKSVWGRPVGVAEARDGALLVTDDGSGTVWRIAPAPASGKGR
ncbi:MAG: PQQ-dependent sugar dehydrogenase [Caulobacteraceae bacterium]